MNKNDKRFSVGETVIALKTTSVARAQPVVKGNKYTVNAIRYCSKCGKQMINVAGSSGIQTVECGCGEVGDAGNLWYTDVKYFARPQDLLAEIESAVEIEDYETAATLTDLIQ